VARTERPQRHHLEDVDVVVDEKKKKKKKMMMMTLNTRTMIAAAADARPTSPPPPPPRFSSLSSIFCFGDKAKKASFFGFSFFFFGLFGRPASPTKQGEERIRGYSYERYKIIPCSSSLFLHFINAHT
jgi:hypothetical protein